MSNQAVFFDTRPTAMLYRDYEAPPQESVALDYFGVDVSRLDGSTVIALRGELDAFTAGLLRQAVDSVDLTGAVHLDARELTFIDSAGLRAVIEVSNRLALLGGTVSVRNARRAVYRVLEITGLVERLHATPASAAS